jgi:DNA-binding transcriptional ArsR family regulator
MDELRATESFAALSQPTRLRVYRYLLKAGPAGVAAGDIAASFGVPHNTLSTHLAVLCRAGLLRSERNGRSIIYAASLKGTRELLTFLVADCCNGQPEICEPLITVAKEACCTPKRGAKRTHERTKL